MKLLSYNEYIKENKIFEQEKQGKRLVNIFVGRFQPFHNGHLKAAEDLYKQNNYPVVIVMVRGTGKSGKGTTFSRELSIKILDDVVKNVKFIIDYIEIPYVAFDTQLFPALRPKYEPVLFGAGEDRYEGYERQRISIKIKHKNKLNMRDDFEIVKTNRYGSGTEVRETIKNGDIEKFKKLMPKFLHKYWNELLNELL